MNIKNGFTTWWLAILIIGLGSINAHAQDDFFDNIDEIVEEAEELVEGLEEQIEKAVKSSLKVVSKAKIPPVPPIPPIKLPDFSDPQKMIENFKGETVKFTDTQTFEVVSGMQLSVKSSFSTVHVAAAPEENRIKVEINRIGGGKTKDIAEKMADRYEVDIEQERNELHIRVDLDGDDQQNNGNTMMHCFVVVTVPEKTPLDVNNEFGSVHISKMNSNMDIENSFGSTHLSMVKGNIDVNSEYDSLHIDGFEGNADISSQFGGAYIKRFDGNLDFENGYGNSEIELINPEATADINFSFGNGTLRLSKDYAGKFSGRSSFGSLVFAGNKIEGKFNGSVSGQGVTLENMKAKKDMFNQSIEGTIGDGLGEIDVNADYSTIYVNFDL